MLKLRFFGLLILGSIGTGISAGQQLCTSSHQTDLYCLLPAAFHTSSAPFNAVYTPFGTELSQLPTAKPAGLILKVENGVLKPANESLGAVFAERAEPLGRHRIFVGFTYQRFGFTSIDGTGLRNIPIILTYQPSNNDTIYTVTQDRIDLKADQFVLLGAVGITNRIDVSVSVPFEKISMSAAVNGTEYETLHGAEAPVHEYVPGSSGGIGDVTFGAKGVILDRENYRIAAGVELRVPSGDELNFLGSGAVGIKPYVAASRSGRWISPHINLGYQWNADSILNTNSQGGKRNLPGDFFYTAGAEVLNLKQLHMNFIVDLLGRHFFDAPRLSSPQPFPIANFGNPTTVEPITGSYTENNFSVGIKGGPFKNFVITGNALFKLNDGGLRSKIVPLAGISYSF
jgi:hypothetical protein